MTLKDGLSKITKSKVVARKDKMSKITKSKTVTLDIKILAIKVCFKKN